MSVFIINSFARALWTPSEITTTAWYDAADLGTITHSGGAISQWDDKSGNDYHVTQSTGSKQPDTGTRTIGGKNVIEFNGGQVLANNAFAMSSALITMFGVLASDTADGVRVISIQNSGSVEMYPWGAGCRSPEQATISIGLNTDINLYSFVKSAADDHELWNNGTSVGTDSTTTTTFTSSDIIIGALNDGSPPTSAFNGRLAEFIVIDSAISTSNRQKVEGYLAWKWGREGSLPSGHKFKSAPPRI